MSSTSILVHEGKAYRETTGPLVQTWTPDPSIQVSAKAPSAKWLGRKIPYAEWMQLSGFLRWTQEEFEEEAMVLLFYNTETGEWRPWAFAQQPNGMTIKLLPDDPTYAEDRKQFGRGWVQAGSVHHHCNANAFQSGTDKHDETGRDGVHITLGKMDETRLDIHVRQVFGEHMSECSLLDWVEAPDYALRVPKKMRDSVILEDLLSTFTVFPSIWKERVKKAAPPQIEERFPTSGQTALLGSTSFWPGKTDAKERTGTTEERLLKVLEKEKIPQMLAYAILTDPEAAEYRHLRKTLLDADIPPLYAEAILEKQLSSGY